MGSYKIAVIPTNFRQVQASDLEIDSGTLSVDATNNRVGINTTSPGASLGVDGDINLQPTAISTAHVTSTGSLTVRADANITIGDSTVDSVRLGRINTTAVKVHVRSGADTDLVVTNSKVGIGTDDPKTDLTVEGPITLKEQAAADGDTAAYGQLWVKTATPNQLYFTTDAGDDIQLTSGTAIVGGGMTSFILEDGDGTEVSVSDAEEVKFVEGDGMDINWTDTSNGSDGDPFDMTFTVTPSANMILHSQVFS